MKTNYLKKYIISSYIIVWMFIIFVAGTASLIFHTPPVIMWIVRNLIAWSPTYLLLIGWKHFRPDETRTAFVKRCFSGKIKLLPLLLSFALTFGQMLAEKFRVLYLNFEHCAGNRELLPDTQTRDLTDLIFFLNTDKERFLLRMQTILQKKGKMDYIPPVRAGMQLLEVTPEEWLEMLRRIGESEEYDYVILDLSENIQGLLQLLRLCTRIFTLTKDDRAARGKVAQYEQVLALYEYEDILQKTSMYKLPRFRKLPESVEQMTRGELADYVRRIMEEMLSEGTGAMEEGAAGKGFIKGGLWQGDDGRRDTGYY